MWMSYRQEKASATTTNVTPSPHATTPIPRSCSGNHSSMTTARMRPRIGRASWRSEATRARVRPDGTSIDRPTNASKTWPGGRYHGPVEGGEVCSRPEELRPLGGDQQEAGDDRVDPAPFPNGADAQGQPGERQPPAHILRPIPGEVSRDLPAQEHVVGHHQHDQQRCQEPKPQFAGD